MIIKKKQVAAQLYTCRDYLKTPKDIKASLKKVKKIGYEAVQLSGLGPIDNAELKKILDGEGLVACATHESADDILSKPAEIAEKLNDLGIKYTAYPFPAGIDFSTAASAKSLARKLDKSGAVLREAGIVLTYHNHNNEFVKFKDKTILELIYENSDPQNLQAEIDTFWVQAGGGSVLEWIKSLKKRLPLLHLKDMAVTPDRKQVITEIGQGNLPWIPIVKAAKSAGCKWFIIEQDNNFIKDNPFTSLKKSFQYVSENLCKDEG